MSGQVGAERSAGVSWRAGNDLREPGRPVCGQEMAGSVMGYSVCVSGVGGWAEHDLAGAVVVVVRVVGDWRWVGSGWVGFGMAGSKPGHDG